MFSNPYVEAEGLARLSPLRLIKYLAWVVMGFSIAWVKTRRYPNLLWGIPAVLCVVLLLTADANSGDELPPGIRQTYLTSTATALDAIQASEDDEQRAMLLEEAEFYLQRLEDSGVANEEFLWQRSRLDAYLGRSQRRWVDLKQILNDQEQPRNADAHLELARGLLLEEWIEPNPIELIESHLLQAIQINQNRNKTIAAQRALADLYLALDRHEEALDLIQSYVSIFPSERLRLARIYLSLGDAARAESQAELAKSHFLRLVEQESQNAADWQQLAQSHFLLGEFEEAVAVLQRTTQVFEDQLVFRRLLARAYVGWSQQLPEAEYAQRLQLLERATEAFPADEFVLLALLSLTMESNGPEGEEAQARLLETLASGDAPVVVHTIIGTKAAIDGNAGLARFHLDQALQQGQATPMVLNNLAHILAFGPQHDYEAALSMIDQALVIQSDPRMHDTRGQILARMQRWTEAIASLETALRDLPGYAPIHQTLAEAYAAIGQDELAEIHQRRLMELGGPVNLDIDAANNLETGVIDSTAESLHDPEESPESVTIPGGETEVP